MQAHQRGRSGQLVNHPAWKALAVLGCLFAAASSAWPQSSGNRVMVLKGAERSEFVPEPGNESDCDKIILLNGMDRTEYAARTEGALPRRSPVTIKMLPPRNLDPGIIEAVRRADGWQATRNPVSRAETGLKKAETGLKNPSPMPILLPPTSTETTQRPTVQLKRMEEPRPEPVPATERRIILQEGNSGAVAPGRVQILQPSEGRLVVSGNFFYKIALVQLASDLAMLIVAVLVFAGAFCLIQRRFGLSADAWRRLESAGNEATAHVELQSRPAPEALADAGSGEALDLGLSYAEEMRLRDEASHQQEQAILRQIYKQNVKLREQIGALEPAA
jgi:hypothetical protein